MVVIPWVCLYVKLTYIASLYFKALVYSDNSTAEVFKAGFGEARVFKAFHEIFLFGEFADAFDQVLVAVFVFGDCFADFRDEVIGIKVINLCQKRVADMRKFKAIETSTGFEHAVRFGQSLIDAGDVAQAEGDCIDIEIVVRKGQVFGVARHPFKALQPAFVDGAVTADAEHVFIEIADRNIGFGAGAFAQAKGNIARAARDIEVFIVRFRTNAADKGIFPQAVQAA